MHVDLRISSLEGMCTFDAESFVRIHQLNELYPHEMDSKRSLIKLPEGRKIMGSSLRPRVKIQFQIESVVCIESSVVFGEVERVPHEKQIATNGNASEIRTKRYYSNIGEVIVASLPLFVANQNVKIRLVQLAPDFDKEETDLIRALYPSFFNMEDTSLCIGVAKVCLRNILVAKSGVSVKLQHKKSMLAAVAALNLSAVATDVMLGRDAGGSAVLTFQAAGLVFSQKSLLKLFFNSQENTAAIAGFVALHDFTNNMDAQTDGSGSRSTVSNEVRLSDLRQQMSSSAVHFVLVPYMVVIHTLLSLSDAVSWQNVKRTFLLLCIILFVFIADVVEIGLMLGFAVEAISIVRLAVLFYQVAPQTNAMDGADISLLGERDSFHAVLYGCHNRIINSMARARLFYSQGLQADCYFELAFVFSRLRRAKRWLVPCLATLTVTLFLLSMETIMVLLLIFAFLVYPLSLRVSPSYTRQIWKRQLPLRVFWKAFSLCSPMHVSRVVLVTDPRERGQAVTASVSRSPFRSMSPARSLVNAHLPTFSYPLTAEEVRNRLALPSAQSPERSLEQIRHAGELGATSRIDSQTLRLMNNFNVGDKTAIAVIGSFKPHAASCSSRTISQSCGEIIKYDIQSIPSLTFAVIVITMEGVPPSFSNAKTNSSGQNNSTNLLVQKLWRVLQRARALGRPPPENLQREQYQAYFGHVLLFLQFLRRQCTIKAYATQNCPSASSHTSDGGGGLIRLEHLAHLSYLLQRGEDDEVTYAMQAHALKRIQLAELKPLVQIDSSARAFALLAAYLLQGSRLSIYSKQGNKSCSIIVPLKLGSCEIEVASEPHPCPLSLQKALVDIWKGWADLESSIFINTDIVMNIITTHKDSWFEGGNNTLVEKDDYHSMIMASQDTGEAARDTSKRILQTFSSLPNANKKQRSNNALTMNSEIPSQLSILGGNRAVDLGPLQLDDDNSLGHLGLFPRKYPAYHRATQSWEYSAPTSLGSNRQLTMPQVTKGVSNTGDATTTTTLGAPVNPNTKKRAESMMLTRSMSSMPRDS